MADSSYIPGIYRKPGGNAMVIASGSTLANEGSIANTGTINNSGSGAVRDQVTAITATTTAYSAVIPNKGVVTLGTTSARKKVRYAIAAPVAGAHVDIVAVSTGSTGQLGWITPSTAGVTFDSTGNRKIPMAGKTSFVRLVGLSATQWRVVGSTGVTLAGT